MESPNDVSGSDQENHNKTRQTDKGTVRKGRRYTISHKQQEEDI